MEVPPSTTGKLKSTWPAALVLLAPDPLLVLDGVVPAPRGRVCEPEQVYLPRMIPLLLLAESNSEQSNSADVCKLKAPCICLRLGSSTLYILRQLRHRTEIEKENQLGEIAVEVKRTSNDGYLLQSVDSLQHCVVSNLAATVDR